MIDGVSSRQVLVYDEMLGGRCKGSRRAIFDCFNVLVVNLVHRVWAKVCLINILSSGNIHLGPLLLIIIRCLPK